MYTRPWIKRWYNEYWCDKTVRDRLTINIHENTRQVSLVNDGNCHHKFRPVGILTQCSQMSGVNGRITNQNGGLKYIRGRSEGRQSPEPRMIQIHSSGGSSLWWLGGQWGGKQGMRGPRGIRAVAIHISWRVWMGAAGGPEFHLGWHAAPGPL